MLGEVDKGLFLHMVEHCDRIINVTKTYTVDAIINTQELLDALCFNIMQIEELAIKLSNAALRTDLNIPWKEIKNMRHKIVHGYGTIEYKIVIDTSINDVPILKNNVIDILNKENNNRKNKKGEKDESRKTKK